MNEPRQKIARLVGESGCYLLCIIHLAERMLHERVDTFETYVEALVRHVIREDCYVNAPDVLMSMLVPGIWSVRWADPHEDTADDEFEVLRFERKATNVTYSHFVCGDGNGGIEYDPMEESLCVSKGKLMSKRLFKRTA